MIIFYVFKRYSVLGYYNFVFYLFDLGWKERIY